MLREFRAFLFRGNIVDLAVAVVIGTAFAAVVKSFVDDVLMQLVAYIFGEPDFGAITLGKLRIGAFLNAVITFVTVAAAVFFVVVKPMESMKARRAKEEAETPAGPTQEELLAEIRDLLRARS